MKKVGLFIAALFCMTFMGTTAFGQLLTEDFNYTAGDNITAHGWTAHSAAGTNPIKVTSPGLTYTGYAGSGIGNAASVTPGTGSSNEDDNRTFTAQSSGSIYAAFMVNVSSASTSGAYFFHLANTSSVTVQVGRVWVKRDASNNLAFGVSKNSTTVNYTGFSYSLNTTYLIVLKYTFVTGSSNDTVDIFINPTPGSSEPTATVSSNDTSSDASSIGAVVLRQDSNTTTPNAAVDGIRIDTNYATAVAAAPPSATTNAATNVTTNSATLNGTVNANGTSTTVTFQYGTDTNYGTTVAGSPSPVTGSSNTAVSANITGLLPNVTYHYRVVATNAGGTTNGSDQQFTTEPATISGQITKGGVGVAGMTVILSGSASSSTSTDSSGNYSFTGLSNGNYTVTPTANGFSFSPTSQSFTNITSNQTGNFTATALVIISEFRLDGPGGSMDEFIELYNTTSSGIDISGYTVVSSDGVISLTVTSTTTIPGYGHYLITNSTGYSLANYGGTGAATGDKSYTADVASNAGIALTNGVGGLLDSVGFTTTSPATGFREGSGLTPATSSVDYSYARKFLTTGLPQDTNVNASDFWLLAVNPASVSGSTAVLGAPGPENLASPVNRTSTMRSSLIDSGGSLGGANASRNTNAYSYTGTSGSISFPAGTLDLRRQITNTTGGNVTRIRIRINNLSTLNSPGYSVGGTQADVRGINSPEVTVSTVNGSVTAQAIVLEEVPPTQTEGGGYNASWIVPLDANTYPSGLPNNQSVIVNIRFGVKQGGQFKFAYTVEVLP